MKTDSSGNKLWNKTYGGSAHDFGYSVIESSDGGLVVAGYTLSFGHQLEEVYLIKTDKEGNLLWQKNYGGAKNDGANSLIQTSDGGFAMMGHTSYPEKIDWDAYLVKTDFLGNLKWTSALGGNSTSYYDGLYQQEAKDWGETVIQSSDGGFVITGSTKSFGAKGFDVYLVKTDKSGNLLWNQNIGGALDDLGQSLLESSDKGYLVVGQYASPGNNYIYLIKTDAYGNIQWTKMVQ